MSDSLRCCARLVLRVRTATVSAPTDDGPPVQFVAEAIICAEPPGGHRGGWACQVPPDEPPRRRPGDVDAPMIIKYVTALQLLVLL